MAVRGKEALGQGIGIQWASGRVGEWASGRVGEWGRYLMYGGEPFISFPRAVCVATLWKEIIKLHA